MIRKVLRGLRAEDLRDASKTIPDKTSEEVAGGDLVMVDVVVVTPEPREYVVIDDPLAAGLEPIDAHLSTSSRAIDEAANESSPEATGDDAIAMERAFRYAWHHEELRDDRVLFFVDHMPPGMYHYRYLARATTLGTFVVPPTRAEEMYVPEVFGRTGATVLRIGEKRP
jgi:uncharacterized protein YfaS (alpha-2-macroglobulin family)